MNLSEKINMENDFEQIAECLKALAHPVRIKILEELGTGRKCVSELSEKIGVTQTNLSQHLGLLKDRGWVKRKREAVYAYYSLSDNKISVVLTRVCEVIHRF